MAVITYVTRLLGNSFWQFNHNWLTNFQMSYLIIIWNQLPKMHKHSKYGNRIAIKSIYSIHVCENNQSTYLLWTFFVELKIQLNPSISKLMCGYRQSTQYFNWSLLIFNIIILSHLPYASTVLYMRKNKDIKISKITEQNIENNFKWV